MQEQNAETSGEITGTGDAALIDFSEHEAEAEQLRQAERDEADAGAGETMPEEEQVEEVDFSTLSEEDARTVLFSGLVEMNARLTEVEQRLILLAQSFVRILEAAGMAEEGTEAPPIEVARTMPTMATKIPPR